MLKECVSVLALSLLLAASKVTAATAAPFALAAGATEAASHASHASRKGDVDPYPQWRAATAHVLATRSDASSLATAAALTFLGAPSRSKIETGKAAAAALELAIKASDLAPDNPAISWLRLLLCMHTPTCDIRVAAMTMRWVAADNGAAWLPTLTIAQRDKDSGGVDRVLAGIAAGSTFELYGNRTAVMIFGVLKRARSQLPANYLKSDTARLNEAMGIAGAAVVPSFSPLIIACRDPSSDAERRDSCLRLAKTMQRADMVMAQLVGFAIEKRLDASDPRELRLVTEHRRELEWRVALANQANLPALSRLAKMRALPREEDVSDAILGELEKRLHRVPRHRRTSTATGYRLPATGYRLPATGPTILLMLIDDAHRLHEGVTNRRADEPESRLFQLAAHGVTGGRLDADVARVEGTQALHPAVGKAPQIILESTGSLAELEVSLRVGNERIDF